MYIIAFKIRYPDNVSLEQNQRPCVGNKQITEKQ